MNTKIHKAKIIETDATPFGTVAVDPIALDIIESALRNARHEMDAVLFRTAMSPGIREQHDEFPLIADRFGRMVVGQFGSFIDGFLRQYAGTVEPGDIFLMSDPYSCEGAISHVNDWLILLPIYHTRSGADGKRLVGWSAMFGHMTDVGGKVPGSLPTDATTIFEEGIAIPPVKIFRAGVRQEDVLEMALNQSRLPHWNRADCNAIIAACRMAERRVIEMCERFGVDTYVSALDEALARNRRAMALLIQRAIPEETLCFEDWICDDGRGMGPWKLKCSMRREGEKVILDWTGTDPQSESSINFFLNENMFKMFFGIYMIMVFDPQILFNDGFYDLVEVHIPDGSLLRPRYPAALSCRTHALGRVFDVLGGLLGQRQPEFLCAAGFSSSPHLMYSGRKQSDGEWFQLFQIGFGGIPGRPFGDGADGHSLWPSFTNVPNEFLEAYFPLRIERYETVPDSGGAGRFRGGNGVNTVYAFLEPGEISIHDDRWFTSPWGVNGGAPGMRSRKLLIREDGSRQILPAKCDNIKVTAGDRLHFVTWGGGGWGDPFTRDPEAVARDVRSGLVTEAGALAYGVVLRENVLINHDATEVLRTRLRSERGAISVFNFGPGIPALRETCLAETGLAPPCAPTFIGLPV
jgi:N-methylhydantoinase B